MPKKQDKEDKLVVLQVDVPQSFRTRLRMQALKKGVTMGELLIQLTKEGLEQSEKS